MKYHIITYGCQMNKSDSERIAAVLERSGYKPAKSESQADLIVVNACSVRQSAVDRIYGKARAFAKLKTCNLKLKTILTGCILPKDEKKLEDGFDLILDTKDWGKFSIFNFQFSNKIPNSKFQIPDSKSFEQETDYLKIKPRYATKFAAYIPIMTGCNNFCSYCVVPYVRGSEVSRDVGDVLAEVRALVRRGCREITLLGQNVNAYWPVDVENFSKENPYLFFERQTKSGGRDLLHCLAKRGVEKAGQNLSFKEGSKNKFTNVFHHGEFCSSIYRYRKDGAFAALLWEVNQVPGVERVHFTAPHPADMSDEAIDALTLPKMVNYLHLPVQSGDDEVLRKMNRKYTAGDYIKLVKKIRKKKPDIALGTDIIVGFPGETEKGFLNTVKLYKKVGFDIAYLAMYSPRAGTAAEKLKDDVPQTEKKRRWNVLQNLMKKITLEKNKKYVGRTVSVLVDEYKKGHCIGSSREMKRVRFFGKKNMVGKIFDVKIKKAYEWILEGTAVAKSSE